MPTRLSPADTQWLRRQALWMLVAALALLAVFENTLLDVSLEQYFFDPATGHFPWQEQWFSPTCCTTASRACRWPSVSAPSPSASMASAAASPGWPPAGWS